MIYLNKQKGFCFPFVSGVGRVVCEAVSLPCLWIVVSLHLFSATFSHISIYKHKSWTETLHKTHFLTSSLGCVSHSCVQYMSSLTANTLKASQTCSQLERLATCCSLKTSGMLATLGCLLVPLAGMGWPHLISRTESPLSSNPTSNILHRLSS